MSDRGFIYDIRRKMQVLAFDIFGPKIMSKLYFKIVLKQNLNLDNPKTFNEKIQWYKLNYCPQHKLIITCTDKYRVREYLEKKGLFEYQVPLLGVWERVEDIKWNELPNKFVLKGNHGCAYNIICNDKETFDIPAAIKKLKRWLKEDFGKFNAEIHYSKIKPCIICEKFIESDNKALVDYKIHCFNGEPRFVLICSERNLNHYNRNYYDINWNKLKYARDIKGDFEKPDSFNEMLRISRIIAKDFPFVRVDFYYVNGKIMIGELTFVPAGGLNAALTREVDLELGKILVL